MTGEDFYYLFSGENREICNTVIRQPRVGELIRHEIDVDELLQPFFSFIELYDIPGEQKIHYKNLDLIFLDHMMCQKENMRQNSMLEGMLNTLRYLCRNNDIEYDLENEAIKINGIAKINRDNFDSLQSYILSIFYAKKPKKQIIKGNEAQKKKVMEMQKKLSQHRKKSGIVIPDVLKVVLNGSHFNHKELLEFTYWQLMDRYSDIMNIDSYKTYMDYKLSPKYELKDDNIKHWAESVKINFK